MADLGGLIRGALGGGTEAAQEVLVSYRADTSQLEAAGAKLEQQAAREQELYDKKAAAAQAANAKTVALEQQYTAIEEALFKARAFNMDQEIAKLSQRRAAVAQQVEASQMVERQLTQEMAVLAKHREALVADAAAMKEQAAGRVGPGGISSIGAAAIGAGSAIASIAAMNAAMALANAVQETATAYVKWGHEVEHTSNLLGTNAQQASLLLYTFQRFNLSTADADRVIIQLSRHVEENENKFRALGVQTRDASGQFRNAYDILQSVRQALNNTADGVTKNTDMMELLARASSGGGQSFAELNAILSLTDDQMAALEREAQRMGLILSDQDAKAAFELQNQMVGLQQAEKGLQVSISQLAVPALAALVGWLQHVAAVAQFATKSTDNLTLSLARAASAWMHFLGSIPGLGLAGMGGDLLDKLIPADAAQRMDDFVNSAIADAQRIADMVDQSGAAPPDVSNAAMNGGRNAETQAIRDQIDALREAAQAREDEMRAALTAYEREHEKAIKTIEDTERAREDAHNEEIKRISDEQRSRDDAFNDAEEQRRATIDALRQEVQAREQALQMEEQQFNLQQDEQDLAREKLDTTTVRGPHENIEDFYKRRYENEQKLAKDTHKVLMDHKRLELDQFKAATDAQIHGIEAVSKAAKDANEQAKRDAEKRIEAIRHEMEEEKRKSQAEIEGIRKAMQAERDRVEAAIKELQRETQAQIKELEKRLKAFESTAIAIGGAWSNLANKMASDQEAAAARARAAWLKAFQDIDHQSPDAKDRNNAGDGTGWTPPDEGAERLGVAADGGWAIWKLLNGAIVDALRNGSIINVEQYAHDYPHDFMLPEPTMLIGKSGKSYGVAAATGPEPISFGGVGGAAGGHGHAIYLDGRKVGEALAERAMGTIASGYGMRQ